MNCSRPIVENRSDCKALGGWIRQHLPMQSLTRPIWIVASSLGVRGASFPLAFAFACLWVAG